MGDVTSALGPILILVGINAGPLIGAIIGTLAGVLSTVVGRSLQELARTEPPPIEVPAAPPAVVTSSNTASNTPTVNQVPIRICFGLH